MTAYLPKSLADQIRVDLRGMDEDTIWRVRRFAEKAYAQAYDEAYIRGYTEGCDAVRNRNEASSTEEPS